MFFIILVITILQHIYLYIYYNNVDNIPHKKEIFTYDLENVQHELTVYRCGNLQATNILFIISGSFNVSFDTYIQKLITMLLHIQFIKNNYQIIIVEKMNKSSIVMYDDISKYIVSFNETIKVSELTLLGFSSGGVIASHVMALLKSLKCKKKIITYDTPYQVLNNVLSFESNLIYRLDLYLYTVVHKTYVNHFNYDKIKDFVSYDSWTNGATDFVKMIKQIHSFTEEDMYFRTGFNFDQEPATKIINMRCEHDPLVNKKISMDYITKNKGDLEIQFDTKFAIGHCSDLIFSDLRIIKYIANFETN